MASNSDQMQFTKSIGQIITCVFVVLALQSCNEDSFSQVINVDIPAHTPVLVVACEIQDGAPNIEAFVSHSLGILDTADFSLIEDATVQLQKDDVTLFPLEFNQQTRRYEHLPQLPFELIPGEYTLTVSTPDFEEVRAVQQAPTPVEISELIFEQDGAILADGSRGHQIDVIWSDPGDETNYYSLEIYTISVNGIYRGHTETIDPTIEYGIDDVFLIDDTSFNGKQYTARLAIDSYNDSFLMPGGRIYAYLRPITRDGYLYSRSRNLYDFNRDNPFAEPVIVHSNIVGGYGIFSLAHISEKWIEF
jgi:hypothetical protein